jgi:hypothetical protein
MKKAVFLALCISWVTNPQAVAGQEEYPLVYFEADNGMGIIMGFQVVADGEVELVAFGDSLLGPSRYKGEVLVPSRVEREVSDGTIIYQVKTIGAGAFQACTELKKLVIEGGVEYIDTAFGGCINLEELVLLEGEKPLRGAGKAFAKTGLAVLWMQRDIEISSSFFHNVLTLKKLIIGEKVTVIGEKVFVDCKRLQEIKIEGAVSTLRFVSALALASCPLEKVYVGRNLLFDAGSPFRDKTMLTNIEFGTDVTSIAERMFMNSTSLYRLTIPGGIKTIETGAFRDCEILSEVTFSESVTEIKGEAFAGCTNIQRIVCLRALPANVGVTAFEGVDRSACELIVPAVSMESYASAPVWRDFTRVVAAKGDGLQSPTEASGDTSVDVYTITGRFVGHYFDNYLPSTLPEGVYLIRNAQGVITKAKR